MTDFPVEVELEEDGRWIAEVPDLPGVIAYGADRAAAVAKVQALASRVIAERLEHGEPVSESVFRFFDFLELESIRRRSELGEADAALLADEIDRAVWDRSRPHVPE